MQTVEARTTVLVCATPPTLPEPQVVLADGSYESDGERVFWRRNPDAEVLRIPLQAPVSVRPIRSVPMQPLAPEGERRLLAAVAAQREVTPPADGHQLLRQRLTVALAESRADAAEAAARVLWQRAGLEAVHDTIAASLARAGSSWAMGTGTVLDERRLSTLASVVLERLRDGVKPTGPTRVVLAVPPGETHTLALTALAHHVEEAGHPALVVDDLPLDELCELAAEPDTLAVVLSLHVAMTAAAARRVLTALREAAPDVLLVVGGPGVPAGTRPADLVTEDPAELLRAIAGRTDPLTEREREVLVAVAEGATNNEIADALCVSPATVKTHLDHVFAKTGTEHRAAAVARALRQGWIT
jgi:two-component system response regulator DesR